MRMVLGHYSTRQRGNMNGAMYQDTYEENLISLAESIWLEDGHFNKTTTPEHTAKITPEVLICSSQSPDLNPIQKSITGILRNF